MKYAVTIKGIAGPLKGKHLVYTGRSVCLIGRSRDCEDALRSGLDATVSRHHCQIEIDPPTARLRDLGSRNGTFVNGVRIGTGNEETGSVTAQSEEVVLHDGDSIRIGGNMFALEISEVDSRVSGNDGDPASSDEYRFALSDF